MQLWSYCDYNVNNHISIAEILFPRYERTFAMNCTLDITWYTLHSCYFPVWLYQKSLLRKKQNTCILKIPCYKNTRFARSVGCTLMKPYSRIRFWIGLIWSFTFLCSSVHSITGCGVFGESGREVYQNVACIRWYSLQQGCQTYFRSQTKCDFMLAGLHRARANEVRTVDSCSPLWHRGNYPAGWIGPRVWHPCSTRMDTVVSFSLEHWRLRINLIKVYKIMVG